MELVKKAKEYSVYKKKSGRHCVLNASKQWIRGEDKVKILLKEGLIKLTPAKKKEEAPAAAAEAPAAAQ